MIRLSVVSCPLSVVQLTGSARSLWVGSFDLSVVSCPWSVVFD